MVKEQTHENILDRLMEGEPVKINGYLENQSGKRMAGIIKIHGSELIDFQQLFESIK